MSFDVDHTVTGLGFQTYFVSQGRNHIKYLPMVERLNI